MTLTEEKAIFDQIQNLEQTKVNIRNAIDAKGVIVSATTPLNDYAEAISYIGKGSNLEDIDHNEIMIPTPPEENFGGGMSIKNAWKPGQVAQTIANEDDYPNEPTYIINNQAEFKIWVQNLIDQKVDGNGNIISHIDGIINNFRTVCIKAGTYNIDDALISSDPNFDQTEILLNKSSTNKLFGENGTILEFSGTKNGTYAISYNEKTTSDAIYVQNLKIILKKNGLKAINNIYFVRAIEVDCNDFNCNDLIDNYEIISRCYIKTANRTGSILKCRGKMNDITCYNVNTIGAENCFIEDANDSTKITHVEMIRCYALGTYRNSAIRLAGDGIIDRFFVQRISFRQLGNNNWSPITGKIIKNGYIHFMQWPEIDQSNYAVRYGIKAIEEINGIKIKYCSMSNGNVFYAPEIKNCAIIDYKVLGQQKYNNTTTDSSIFNGDKLISSCAIYYFGLQESGSSAASIDITVFNSEDAISDCYFGNMSWNAAGWILYFYMFRNCDKVTRNLINNIKVFSGGTSQVNELGIHFTLFDNCRIISKNKIRNIDILDAKDNDSTALVNILSNGSFIENSFGMITITNKSTLSNYSIFSGGKTYRNNKIGSLHYQLKSTATSKIPSDYWALISTDEDGARIENNSFGNFVIGNFYSYNYHIPYVFSWVRTSTNNVKIKNNYFGELSVCSLASFAYIYGIWILGENAEITNNHLELIKADIRLSGASAANTMLRCHGIHAKNNKVIIMDNTVNVQGGTERTTLNTGSIINNTSTVITAGNCAIFIESTEGESSKFNENNIISAQNPFASTNSQAYSMGMGLGIANLKKIKNTKITPDKTIDGVHTYVGCTFSTVMGTVTKSASNLNVDSEDGIPVSNGFELGTKEELAGKTLTIRLTSSSEEEAGLIWFGSEDNKVQEMFERVPQGNNTFTCDLDANRDWPDVISLNVEVINNSINIETITVEWQGLVPGPINSTPEGGNNEVCEDYVTYQNFE